MHTCIETASPLSNSCSDVCGPALPTPEPANVSTRRYLQHMCLVHFLLRDSPDRIVRSQVVGNLMSVRATA